jgi:UDP-sugar pyrophosphorylase
MHTVFLSDLTSSTSTGNINQLLFAAKPYLAALEATKGAMPEFVNPKYKDATKIEFKKPTRLECMMQEFPTILKDSDAEKVGFTSIAASMCFSPVKNATSDGAELQKSGTHPGVAATGEADQYGAVRLILKSIGVKVDDGDVETFMGIEIIGGPEIVIQPGIALCPGEYKKLFPNPKGVSISKKSSLVIKGSADLAIESMTLDGALVIQCEEGSKCILRDIVVKNDGWVRIAANSSTSEVIAMRGYTLEKNQTKTIIIKRDGSLEGYDPVVLQPVPKPPAEQPVIQSPTVPTPSIEAVSEENKEEEYWVEEKGEPNTTEAPASLTEPSIKELSQSASSSGCPCTIM